MSILKNIGVGLEFTIGKWCKEVGIENYVVVGGKINVNGNVVLSRQEFSKFPYPFGVVSGYFYCNYCKNLTSLEGAPREVGRNFNCSSCRNLESLVGSPEVVRGNFECAYCDNLKSLKGASGYVLGNFNCCYCNNLKSLEGSLQKVGRIFSCWGCENLKSLGNITKSVKGHVTPPEHLKRNK